MIQRAKVSEEQINASIASLNQKLTNEHEARVATMKRRAQLLADVMAPVHALIKQDQKAVSALHTLQELAEEEKRQREQAQQARKNLYPSRGKQFFLTVNPGLNFLVPPYDTAWASLPGFASVDPSAGTFWNRDD